MKTNDIQIEVKAFGVNRLDLEMLKRTNNIGVEVSGIVTNVSSHSSQFKLGDRVCSLVQEGGYGAKVIAPEETTFLIPNHLDFIEGAALPEALFTIALNLFEFAKIAKGNKVLIHSATGCIGNLSLEICRAMKAEADATTSRIENEEILKSWGSQNIFKSDSSWEKPDTYDIIFDNSGASLFPKNINSLKNNGRLVMVDAFLGEKSEIDLGQLLDKSLQIYGSLLRPRSLEKKLKLKNIIEAEILQLFTHYNIKPYIMKTFSYENINEAHELLQNRKHLGKLIGVRR